MKEIFQLTLVRKWPSEAYIQGWMTDSCGDLYYTLESPKEPFTGAGGNGCVCIPSGEYEIKFEYSPHLKTVVPTLKAVPGHDHILIHILNFPHETKGCIGVGLDRGPGVLYNSGNAYTLLVKNLEAAITSGATVRLKILEYPIIIPADLGGANGPINGAGDSGSGEQKVPGTVTA